MESLADLCDRGGYLGRPVPGPLGESAGLAPQVKLEGPADARRLTWWWPSLGTVPAPAAQLTNDEFDRFLTLRRAADWKLLKKGRNKLAQRRRSPVSDEQGWDEIATNFQDAGFSVMVVRRVDSFSGGVGALDDFVRLFKEPEDNVILAYAQKWGVLRICQHEKPYTHSRECLPLGFQLHPRGPGWEPVSVWREYSRYGHRLLTSAAELFAERPPSTPEKARRSASWIRLLESLERDWLEISEVRLSLDDYAGKPDSWPRDTRLGFKGGGLFELICVQLLLAVMRADELSLCGSCNDPFVKAKRRRKGEHCYCPACRANGDAGRAAARTWWRRRNKALREKEP